MNTGAFGEGFPYSNFHDLNMDWIIKIAKDFLDQYTHIQDIITNGETSLTTMKDQYLQELEDEKDTLESALNDWYNTHSDDIANELADALQQISTTLSSAITQFNTNANLKAEEAIASIPADYTTLSNTVLAINNALVNVTGYNLNDALFPINLYDPDNLTVGRYLGKDGTWYDGGSYVNYSVTNYIRTISGRTLYFYSDSHGSWANRQISRVVAFNKYFEAISDVDVTNVNSYIIPNNVPYVRLVVNNGYIGTNNAVFIEDERTYIPSGIPSVSYGVNSEVVSNFKYCYPLTRSALYIQYVNNELKFTANGIFITSDNKLIRCNNDVLNMTMTDTITGVAITSAGHIIQATPTGGHKSDTPYFLAMWYEGNLFYDNGNISNVYSNPNGLISGRAFAWISNSKLYMTCTEATRFMYNGLSQSSFISQIISSPAELTLAGTGTITYIYYDETGLHGAVKPPKTGYVLGYVYDYMFTSIDPRIIANRMPIFNIKQRADVPTFVNFRRLGYRLVPPSQARYSSEYAFFETSARITNAYNDSDIKYVWMEDDSIDSMPVTFVQNSSNLSGKKILTVGDSITARGFYQNFIAQEANVEFVGTQTSIYHNIKCEGYSGMSASYIFGSSGPFWNPGTNALDFGYYCTSNNINPNIVIVMLGLNESETPQQYFDYMQNFITNIKNYNSNITVYVSIPFGEAYKAWYGASAMLFSRFKNMLLFQCQCYGLSDCTLIPAYYIIDDNVDYPTRNVEYGVNNLQMEVIEDGVHPSENTGFKKLANIIYNYLE